MIQQYVLNEALAGHRLVDVLNGWEPHTAEWARKREHVPELASATAALVKSGLIEVYLEPSATSDLIKVRSEEAAAVVGDHGNWWGADWVDEPSSSDLTEIANYVLIATDPARRT